MTQLGRIVSTSHWSKITNREDQIFNLSPFTYELFARERAQGLARVAALVRGERTSSSIALRMEGLVDGRDTWLRKP